MKKEYILVLNKDVTEAQFNALLAKHEIDIAVDFKALERHYTITFEESKKVAVKAEPEILHVTEADAPVKLMAVQHISVEATGYGGNWGLTRICKRDNWNDNTWYPNSGDYTYFRTGKNVDVYVVDTGARLTHTEFAGRIEVVYDHYRSPTDSAYGVDQQGHGTHVASTVAGTKYGVAKEARILVSRVFETGGATLSAIIAGINACLVHHKDKKASGSNRPSVMNLSLGGPAHIIEEQAINDCIDNGIVCVAAAGNDGTDLSEPNYDVMPAEIERAITVGSIDIQDQMSSFSNYGWQVDTFAPGHYITAAGMNTDTEERMLSGTSMASPHVAGICALYLEDYGITQNSTHVKEVHDWIWNNSTPNTLYLSESVKSAGTANKTVFSDFITESEPVPVPVTEVGRSVEDKIETDVVRGDPIVTTTYIDTTETINKADGSIIVRVIRTYTDTTTVIVITTTIITPVITISYSDGSTGVIYGDPVSTVTMSEEITTATRTELISEEITPAPTPEPAPKPEKGKKKGWWKKNRAWARRRGAWRINRQLKRIERKYDRCPNRVAELEDLLLDLEDMASILVTMRGRSRISIVMEFLKLQEKIYNLIRQNR